MEEGWYLQNSVRLPVYLSSRLCCVYLLVRVLGVRIRY